MSTLPIEVL
jgi:hypothetical protein